MLFVTNRCAGCTIEKSINGMEFGAYRRRSHSLRYNERLQLRREHSDAEKPLSSGLFHLLNDLLRNIFLRESSTRFRIVHTLCPFWDPAFQLLR